MRNSGALTVVEGVGDHGCEYMTGGRVVIIGKTGRNFAAGMSGGIAYVLDKNQDFKIRCNLEMVELEAMDDDEDVKTVTGMLGKHVQYTQSTVAKQILDNWNDYRTRFVKVMPSDYKRVLNAIKTARENGMDEDEAIMEAAHG